MKCPYETLGVGRQATPQQITKMYRLLAKRYHPDRNVGDAEAAEKYTEVDRAYKLLSDPVRREMYDRTGNTDEPKPAAVDAELAELAVTLQNALCAIVSRFSQGLGDYKRANLLKEIQAQVGREIAQTEQVLDQVERHLQVLKEVEEKVEGPEEGNVLLDVARAQRGRVESDQMKLRKQLDLYTRAKQYLADLKYKGALSELGGGFAAVYGTATNTWTNLGRQ